MFLRLLCVANVGESFQSSIATTGNVINQAALLISPDSIISSSIVNQFGGMKFLTFEI